MRFGLCCQFLREPIQYRTTTAKAMFLIKEEQRMDRIREIFDHNLDSLLESVKFCAENDIRNFRITSSILPLVNHPDMGFPFEGFLSKEMRLKMQRCRRFCKEHDIRLTMHPDQFVILNSPNKSVADAALADLQFQAEFADYVGCDTLIIHGGGAYDNKDEALYRLDRALRELPEVIKSKIAVENDDKLFTPSELLHVCQGSSTPFVYDIHHHRCNKDYLSPEEAFYLSVETWNREPVVHISSPKNGWDSSNPRDHHDFIDINDFPPFWSPGVNITVEVEAKAKEMAVLQLRQQLGY